MKTISPQNQDVQQIPSMRKMKKTIKAHHNQVSTKSAMNRKSYGKTQVPMYKDRNDKRILVRNIGTLMKKQRQTNKNSQHSILYPTKTALKTEMK